MGGSGQTSHHGGRILRELPLLLSVRRSCLRADHPHHAIRVGMTFRDGGSLLGPAVKLKGTASKRGVGCVLYRPARPGLCGLEYPGLEEGSNLTHVGSPAEQREMVLLPGLL
ncbi:hypothetical protein NDU88_001191 [Pleurodeles waltl]|uniref:Uncharacterized protein n=1 Tax=Pleurodeles waltl TaxID=8319 RepID=A0AAV7RAW9_PLEWA|nr:hypothetical protein NDU88_001191 [Pleurodeles waltl]